MFGANIIWNGIPFGPLLMGHTFWPVSDFACSAGVKLEDDDENGQTRATGRTLQTCGFSIRVTRNTGGYPRLVFDILDKLKGMSSPLFISNGVTLSLANNVLDMIQTSDWTKITSLEGAASLAASLFMGSKLGGVSFMLTAVEIQSEHIGADGELLTADIYLSFTEDAGQRQPGGMKVLINDVDIMDSISVTDCIYEMHAEGQADTLTLKFADTKKQWVGWKPKQDEKGKRGDLVKVTDGVINTGQMYIESLKPENGAYVLTAYSVPKKAFDKKSRSFEKLPLSQIAKKIAGEYGLELATYGLRDQIHPYVKQNAKSDLAFLNERCRLAGAAFLVFDGKLCLYDERTMENRDAVKTLTISPTAEAVFTDDSHEAYTSAQVTNSDHTGTASDPHVQTGKTYLLSLPEKVSSLADMNRLSQTVLRGINKKKKRGEIFLSTQRELAAGSVINLIANGWAGKAFIYRCRHDLKAHKTRFWVREPLDY